jgi:drug/metabolite transporter (DMT)-like permease
VVIIGAGAHAGGDTLPGHLLILGSALSAATYALLARRYSRRSPALVVTTYQLLAATAVAVPYTIATHAARRSGLPAADAGHWAAAIASGLVGVALPFLLYNRAIRRMRATVAAGVLNLIPLVGFVTAVVFLGNSPTLGEVLGGGLILFSAAWLGRSEARANLGTASTGVPER